jgi:hypothetical protein
LNATATVPNSWYQTAWVNAAGGSFTASESYSAGDYLVHTVLLTKPATTQAMQCSLFRGSTNMLITAGITISAAATSAIFDIREHITGASSQMLNVFGYNSAGGSLAQDISTKSVSNTTPSWQWKCGNATSDDSDDAVTLASWTITRWKTF